MSIFLQLKADQEGDTYFRTTKAGKMSTPWLVPLDSSPSRDSTTQTDKDKTHVAVIGGGLVGSLQALLLAKRGFEVDLYERRKDIRSKEQVQGRSINLSLSHRGMEALKELGLENIVLKNALPMYARKIHSLTGKQSTMAYGTENQCIYSVDRQKLNKLLLDYADRNPRIRIYFQHQLVRANLGDKKLTFHQLGPKKQDTVELTVEKNFIFGCDGAFSSIRRQMMRWGKMDYSQEYIEHGYKELTMPPANETFAMDEKCLHIWPRGEFMMIALPNMDCSFTLTLFMPYSVFQSIETEENLLTFFMMHFHDSVGLIGIDRLIQDFFKNPTSSLISVKCNPHFMADSTVILGDAAHAVVPFYGQGMNAGFEDCLIFNECLVKLDNSLMLAAKRYNDIHWRDCHAIADLSMYNYLEMRSHVNHWMFWFRKKIDNMLYFFLPGMFIPLYTMVAFTRIPYSQVVSRNVWQRRFVNYGLFVIKIGAVAGLLCILYKASGIHTPLKYRILPHVFRGVVEEIQIKDIVK